MQLLFESSDYLRVTSIQRNTVHVCVQQHAVYMCIAKILITFTPNNGGCVLAESFVHVALNS